MSNSIGFLKFQPVFQYRIWGGEKLKTVLGKSYTENNIGESWEISGVKGSETEVLEGNLKGEVLSSLIDKYTENLVGTKCFKEYGNEFPILIKFLDAAAPLSVQVHPDDALSKKRHNSLGKNEMWYIMDADDDATLTIGFKEELNKESFKKHLEEGSLLSVLNEVDVKKGDLYYLPVGRVHAVGKGVMLAEVQQTSDVTYRVYDYDRIDQKTGKKRELHVEESMDAIDFSLIENYKTPFLEKSNQLNEMIDTPFFKTNLIKASEEISLDYKLNQSFKIFICTEGEAILEIENQTISIKKGETVLLPANEKRLTILPQENVVLLEVAY